MHVFPCLRSVKTVLEPYLGPLGMLVDMDKGNKESGTVAFRDQLKKKNCTLECFYRMPVTRLENR
jgi:hypothetical protein